MDTASSPGRAATIAGFFALVALGVGAGYLLDGDETSKQRSDTGTTATPATPTETAIARAEPPSQPHAVVTRASVLNRREKTDVRAVARELLEQGRDALAEADWLAAAEAFQAAVELDSNVQTEEALGALYMRLAVFTRAHVHLRRAAALDPDNPDRWIALANAHRLRHEPLVAAQHLRKAHALDPTLELAKDENGYAYRVEDGPGSVYSSSPYIPTVVTRRTLR